MDILTCSVKIKMIGINYMKGEMCACSINQKQRPSQGPQGADAVLHGLEQVAVPCANACLC